MLVDSFKVDSPSVEYGPDFIRSTYTYQHTEVELEGGKCTLKPKTAPRAPPYSCSVMLVGWGGNNGTTVTGGILANKQ